MVGHVEVEVERLYRVVTILLVGDISRLHHLLQHHIAAVATTIGIAHGIEIRWILTQSHKRGSLVEGEVLGLLSEICVGSCFYTDSIV